MKPELGAYYFNIERYEKIVTTWVSEAVVKYKYVDNDKRGVSEYRIATEDFNRIFVNQLPYDNAIENQENRCFACNHHVIAHDSGPCNLCACTHFRLGEELLIKTHESGGVREEAKHYYHSIPPESLRALADIFYEGSLRYGDYNWLKGLPLSTYIDHLMEHLIKFAEGDRNEDHLAKIMWGACCARETLIRHPDLDDLPWSKKDESF